MKLDSESQNYLIDLAKRQIHNRLNHKYHPEVKKPIHTPFGVPFGAFVSVYVGEELHGCLGRFSNKLPLTELIEILSISAAFTDKRFDPVTTNDLSQLRIEISILSPLKKINSIDAITIGKHGIYIKENYNTGTLLPQVAEKHNWTPEEFVRYCSKHKAGLGWDGWKTADLHTYTAEVFTG